MAHEVALDLLRQLSEHLYNLLIRERHDALTRMGTR